jgi:hypothetical protein
LRIPPARALAVCTLGLALLTPLAAQATETIVLLRHGEKPDGGYGQLNCQGLNRALALSTLLPQKFGNPDFLFAPMPGLKKDSAGTFNYIRPLATIEPTAISLGMPVDTRFEFADIHGLEQALLQPRYHDKRIFVAWEHKEAEELARDLMKQYGDRTEIPKWSSKDFDSLYILKIDYPGNKPHVTFMHDVQGLNDQPLTCIRSR